MDFLINSFICFYLVKVMFSKQILLILDSVHANNEKKSCFVYIKEKGLPPNFPLIPEC